MSVKAQKLFEAVRANNEAEVNTHLSGASKADVNYLAKNPSWAGEFSALMVAAEKGNVNIAKSLLKAGADPELTGTTGWTALVWAVRSNRVDMIHALVKAGVNVNSQASGGFTALMHAVRWGEKACMQALLDEGADPQIMNNQKERAVDFAKDDQTKALLNAHKPGSTPPVAPAKPAPAAAPAPPPAPVPVPASTGSALRPPAPPAAVTKVEAVDPAAAQCTALESECAAHVQKVLRATAKQRQDLVQAQLNAVLEAGTDLKLVFALGQSLEMLQAEATQLPTLSEEACAELPDQHEALIQRVEKKAWEFARAKQYKLTERLYVKLEELKALDLSGIAQPCDSDPVWVDMSNVQISG